ncbi:ATP-binding protein [Actibacterium sp. 188UL27-1]|uniref:ATP-binding protein n=1 Tax=Actibacterium sp. 188UL27-1 TaxID=2786961 RepID=UPI00195B1BD9|nr:ATP-binding protein [Actibacterium sp. 188UL27-1]MBM7069500.1 ATP-binding protein [Actibacterium sp. 188UL27-1]
MDIFYAPRDALAQTMADRLSPDPIMGTPAGLFLAAPRRTGKSSFLRGDLMPHLRDRGLYPIYVDLWADPQADPGELIANVLAQELDALGDRRTRLLGALPFKTLTVAGFRIDLKQADGARSATLADALAEIGKRAAADVVFIVDEAQHALSSPTGMHAMFALKAARDAMNQTPDSTRLYLVFTGSHRDKLAGLTLTSKAPFFGAQVADFPRLDRSYVDALVDHINPKLADDNKLDRDDVEAAFKLLGYRPEKLTQVIRDHALGTAGSAGLRQTIRDRADALRALVWQQHESDFGRLTDVQRAVLRVLIDRGSDFAPFTPVTYAAVKRMTDHDVGQSQIQNALDDLRDKSLIWRPSRGVYALEDQDLREWLLAHIS